MTTFGGRKGCAPPRRTPNESTGSSTGCWRPSVRIRAPLLSTSVAATVGFWKGWPVKWAPPPVSSVSSLRVLARTTRLKVPQATIWEGTLETIDLPHQFDVAISSEVIEHVPDQPSFVAALSGVLKNDALLVLTTPNGRFRETFFRDFSDPQPVENWLNIHDIRILFTKWFSLEHYTTFDLSYYYNYVNSSLGALQRKVTRVGGGWRFWNAVVDAPLGRMGGFGLYQLIVLKRHCQ